MCLTNFFRFYSLRLRATDATLLANNSQHCCMLHVASVCTPCCMLLDVVACCCAKFETGQTFSPVQTDATLLPYNAQHCWELLRPFGRSLTLLLLLKASSTRIRKFVKTQFFFTNLNKISFNNYNA